MRVSVVVPTFNRGPALAETLQRLAASELSEGDDLEILVVDDGSAVPAQETVATARPTGAAPRWPVTWIRQANAGPAVARNTGFKAGAGEVTLFVDDDILVPPDLVRSHVAAHRARPGSVIFGANPSSRSQEGYPLRAFLEDPSSSGEPDADGFVAKAVVASGQISVEREQFGPDGVYSPEMVTPAAEEYELSVRLRRRGIPILCAPRIVGQHDQPLDIASYCRQQYKHGVGCGEAAAKRPDLLELTELDRIVLAARPRPDVRFSARRRLKTLATLPAMRAALLRLAQGLEHVPAPSRLLFAAYRAAISAYFTAGVRDGLTRFGSRDREPGAERGGRPPC